MARNAKRSNSSPSDDFWALEAEELPRADVATVHSAARRIRLFRIWVVASVVLLPIALLAIISFLPKFLEEPAAAPALDNQVNSPTKPVAMQAVRTWLAGAPSPLPGGQLLSWDGVKIQAEPDLSVNPDTNQTTERQGLELHTMTLLSPTGAFFTTQVQVGYSPFRGAKVIGQPTLIPRAPDEKQAFPNLKSWPNLDLAGRTEPIDQAATAWAKAFTSGDPDTLRLAVGDTTANRSYVPLVQATATDVRVGEVAAEKPETSAVAGPPSRVVAQVSFAVTWEGQVLGRGEAPARVSYDVLIDQADTASPKVVAWGGSGAGESLTPFMNGIDGRKITADTVENAVPSPEAGK